MLWREDMSEWQLLCTFCKGRISVPSISNEWLGHLRDTYGNNSRADMDSLRVWGLTQWGCWISWALGSAERYLFEVEKICYNRKSNGSVSFQDTLLDQRWAARVRDGRQNPFPQVCRKLKHNIWLIGSLTLLFFLWFFSSLTGGDSSKSYLQSAGSQSREWTAHGRLWKTGQRCKYP